MLAKSRTNRLAQSRRFGIFCLVTATLLWSFTAIFVKHFSFQKIDGDVQNLFRYASATLGLWVLVVARFGREALEARTRLSVFLLPTFFNCAFQGAMVSSLYRESVYPGFMSLVMKSTVLFATILAFILFREERRILSVRYVGGFALAGAGVVGVVMFGRGAHADFNEGVALLILAAFLWACYTLAMKRVVRDTRPIVAFAIVATFTTLFFIGLTCARSRPSQFFRLWGPDQGLLILSGLACISAAHSLYFRAVDRLGVAVCASFLLVTPLSTGLLSALLLGESFRAAQMPAGAVLLAGAYLVVKAGAQGEAR